ncbi:phosphohistidine phosphatase SixA [Isoalcanivorax indicus]|uniref:phosphohistidine phosphatase SixA n=1 Tax=Isoalcanivorax indicus TaxID=2202653 RepID=UPI000DB951F3|nr:phosphohistidine phosphatase SixA [Isoalcanivorax indicus]
MRLYVVRHGEAEAQRTTDEARALTDAGRRGVQRLWQNLLAEGVRPATLISSPYVRARQTADEIAAQCGLAVDDTCDLLVPDGHPQRVFDWLLARDDSGPLVLVSHMPLVAHLVGQLSEGPGARLPMGVGAVAALEVEVPAVAGARLLWLRAPGDLFLE